MGGPVTQLQDAGFSDDEIADWSRQQRDTLSQAGFSGPEIDEHLTGVRVPERVPQALLDRFESGMRTDRAVIGAVGRGIKDGFSTGPAMPETDAWMRKIGMFPDPETGRGGPLRTLNQALLTPVMALADGVNRAFQAGFSGATEGVSEAVVQGVKTQRATAGQKLTSGEEGSLRRDLGALSQAAMMASGEGEESLRQGLGAWSEAALMASGNHPAVRSEISPAGVPVDIPVGGKPGAVTFVDAARAVAGRGDNTLVEQKLLRLYEDHGIHPAEVAHDAATDPTVAQALLSTTDELPQRYVAPTVAPVEPPAPGAADPMRDALAATVAQDLRATGLPEDQVVANAELTAAHYATLGKILGRDPEELYRENLQIQAAQVPTNEEGRSFDQAAEGEAPPILRRMAAKYGEDTSLDAWLPQDRNAYFAAVDRDIDAREARERAPLLEDRIRDAVTKLQGSPQRDGVRLSDLRRELSDVDRATLDKEIVRLFEGGKANLMNLSNPPDIEREASSAIRYKGVDQQVLWMKPRRAFDQPATVPTFYSTVERAVASAKQAKASPEQWLATLRNTPGVKPEEMQWLGLEDWLKDQAGPVTREQVADYVRANRIDVQEVTKGAMSPEVRQRKVELQAQLDSLNAYRGYLVSRVTNPRPSPLGRITRRADKAALAEVNEQIHAAQQETARLPADDTRYNRGNFVLPGAEPGSYREMLLTLPMKITKTADQLAEEGTLDPEHDEESVTSLTGQQPYQSSHWPETPNVLAHVRFNDRVVDGKKTLLVEEVQSDWHQAGRKHGYREEYKGRALSDIEDDLNRITETARQSGALKQNSSGRWEISGGLKERYESLLREREKAASGLVGGVPDAPFKTTWPELALKRILRYAAENGYEKVAWAPGDVHAARYDLSKQVDRVEYSPENESLKAFKGRDKLISKEQVKPDDLPDLIGKEATDRLLNNPTEKTTLSRAHIDLPDAHLHVLSGLDLKVGGEGMRGFYDKILPATANKLVKKFGARVGEDRLSVGKAGTTGYSVGQGSDGHWYVSEDGVGDVGSSHASRQEAEAWLQNHLGSSDSQPVHSVDITPQLRQAAVEQGFPLFQEGQGPVEPRGRVTFRDAGPAIVQLFQSRDASTFAHEAAHVWLDELARYGGASDAPTQMRKDMQTVFDWLGVQSADEITTAHHEQWAQAFERYLADGKAPTSRLQRVFDQFSEWLIQIYWSLTRMGHEVPLDIKAVMDRMLATDDEIATAKGENIGSSSGGEGGTGLPAAGGPTPLAGAGGGQPPTEPPEGGVPATPASPLPPLSSGALSDAQKKILDHLSVGEPNAKRAYTTDQLYTDTVDKLFPISQAVDEAAGRNVLPTWQDPYRLARLISGVAGKGEHMVEHGTFDFNTYAVNGKSLRQVLEPVKDDIQGFRAFVAATRAAELENLRDIRTGFDMSAAEEVVRDGAAKYGPVAKELFDYQERVARYLKDSGVLSEAGFKAMLDANRYYVPFNRVMGDGIETRVGIGGPSLQAKNPIHNIEGSLRRVVDPLENIIRNTYLFTSMAEKNAVGTALVDMLKTVSGTVEEAPRLPGEPIDVPFEEVRQIPGAFSRLPDAPRDATNQALTKWLADQHVEAPEDLVDAMRAEAEGDAEGNITIFRDGKKETYSVDPELARAMKGLDVETTHWLLRLVSLPTSLLRAGAVLTPDFALRHSIRDYIYANLTSKQGFISPIDMWQGMVGLLSKDKDYQDWLKGGGAAVSSVSLDRRYLQQKLDSLTAQTGLMTRAWNVIGDPNSTGPQRAGAVALLPFQMVGKFVISPLQAVTEFSESLSHFAAFKKAMRGAARGDVTALPARGYTPLLSEPTGTEVAFPNSAMTSGSRADTHSTVLAASQDVENKRKIQDAAWMSRDTAVDASRMGAKMRSINALCAFANITLQDTDRMVRAFYRDPAATTLKVLLGIVLPSAAIWYLTKDAVDSAGNNIRDNLPDWEKDTFWVIPTGGPVFRIPKSFGTGVLFGSGTERMLDALFREKPDAFKGFFKSLEEATVPNFVPTIASPVLEQFANRSLYTNRTLVPADMEKNLPEYQYTQYTSQTARAVGRLLGAFPGVRDTSLDPSSPGQGVAKAISSPILLENYLRAWTGTLGAYALQVTDAALRKTGMLPDPPQPASTLADIPFVRAFTVRYPTASSQQVQDFMDLYDRNKAYYDTWQRLAKEGDGESAQRVAQAGGPQMFARLDAIRKTVQEQNQLVRNIYRNPTMPPDEKRQLIDQAYYGMTQVGAEGLKMIRAVNAAASREPAWPIMPPVPSLQPPVPTRP